MRRCNHPPGDDPFWEAVDLWYGSTGDIEWYDPQQVTTRDGALVITMDSTDTTAPGGKIIVLLSIDSNSFCPRHPEFYRSVCTSRQSSAEL